VKNGTSKKYISKSGTWKFKTVPNQKGFFASRNMVSVLEKVNNQWRYRNKISGFDYSARYFEITDAFEIYVSHEYKGVLGYSWIMIIKAKSVTAYEQQKGKKRSLTKNLTIRFIMLIKRGFQAEQ
jgi:hypothetical protein